MNNLNGLTAIDHDGKTVRRRLQKDHLNKTFVTIDGERFRVYKRRGQAVTGDPMTAKNVKWIWTQHEKIDRILSDYKRFGYRIEFVESMVQSFKIRVSRRRDVLEKYFPLDLYEIGNWFDYADSVIEKEYEGSRRLYKINEKNYKKVFTR